MVRKQLYIDETQERKLKARSRELGISEAEIVRRGLDRELAGEPTATRARPGAAAHIEAFLARAREISERGTTLIPYGREDLYPGRGMPRGRQ